MSKQDQSHGASLRALVRPLLLGGLLLLGVLLLFGGRGLNAQEPVADRMAAADGPAFAAFLAMVEEDALVSGAAAAQSENGAQGERLPEPEPADPNADALLLSDVVASLYRSFPDIERARQQRALAGGELRSAYGAYDTKFKAGSLSEPTGFYENYRNGLGVARQVWWGGSVAAGYRIGRGFYQPWYKERQTDDAGEFKVSVQQPLLQGRAIDPQRVEVFQASIRQRAATPIFREAILAVSREAISTYWEWVAAGAVLKAQQELLDLAIQRGQKFEVGVNAGAFAEIDLILNRQLIAERRADRLKALQKFRETGFKLSLFLRDQSGQPLVPNDNWLPKQFPRIEPQGEFNFNAELAAAISRRPEVELLQYEYRHVELDRRLASNELLPRFDFVTEASQDMGEPATKSDDKGEFELVIGFQSEVPIQRRKARGKIQSSNAKMIQVNEKLRLVRDKIATDIQITQNRLTLAQQVVEQSEVSLMSALDTLRRYQKGFEKGYIDLIYLNLLETKANQSKIKLVEAQRDWFATLGALQVALGLDPLDQASILSSLPASTMPGPGNLPELNLPNDRDFERDWQLHDRADEK